MSYKIDSEKGFKLLRCVSPPIIFVNGPLAVGKSEFTNKFKKEGFSVLNINDIVSEKENNKIIETVQKYLKNRKLKSFDHNSLIIEANITDDKLISDIFNDEFHNFTYVFIYPNNSTNYKEHLLLKIKSEESLLLPKGQEDIKSMIKTMISNEENNKKINKLTVDLINITKNVYSKHLETFDNKILTILV